MDAYKDPHRGVTRPASTHVLRHRQAIFVWPLLMAMLIAAHFFLDIPRLWVTLGLAGLGLLSILHLVFATEWHAP
jgi:hypothetical protein